MIDTDRLGLRTANYCYFPIFTHEADVPEKAQDIWYLGNIFLNKYLIVHDVDKYE